MQGGSSPWLYLRDRSDDVVAPMKTNNATHYITVLHTNGPFRCLLVLGKIIFRLWLHHEPLTNYCILQLHCAKAPFHSFATPVEADGQGVGHSVSQNAPHCVWKTWSTNYTQTCNLKERKLCSSTQVKDAWKIVQPHFFTLNSDWPKMILWF